MESIFNWFEQLFGVEQLPQTKILASVIVIISLVVIRRVMLIVVYRRTKSLNKRYRWRKSTSYIAFTLAAFIVGGIWFRGFQYFSTYLGLLSAGLAIALQTPLTNLAGWLFILWRHPFVVGDRIQIGDVRGDVIDQRIFMFSIMEIGNWVDAEQSTGRLIHIPNGKIFSEHLANYTDGFHHIWNEIPVLVTFESDWEKAKEILTEIADKRGNQFTGEAEKQIKEAASKALIYLNKLTPIVYTSVRDHGVLLTMRYLCNPRRRRGSEQQIWEDILHAFAEHPDIDFAYPTQRHYLNYIEGKPKARAETQSKAQGE